MAAQRDCEPTMFNDDQSSIRLELIQNGWWDPTRSRGTARVTMRFWDNRSAARWSHRRQFLCFSLVQYVGTDKGGIANVESRKCDLTEGWGSFIDIVCLSLVYGQVIAVHRPQWDAITQPWLNFNGGLAKPFQRMFSQYTTEVRVWVSKYIP